jgi:hypothetical protein
MIDFSDVCRKDGPDLQLDGRVRRFDIHHDSSANELFRRQPAAIKVRRKVPVNAQRVHYAILKREW